MVKDTAVNAKVTLSEQRIKDLFTGAFEGGSNYWVRRISHRPDFDGSLTLDENDKLPLNLPFTITYDNPDGDDATRRKRISRAAIDKGLSLMAAKAPRHFANILDENDDAETADVFLQFVVLGDIIFG